MNKRLPLFVTAALVGVMFVFALALIYMVRYYRLSQVEQMEQRLEAIARTLASGLEEESMIALAEVYSPVIGSLNSIYGEASGQDDVAEVDSGTTETFSLDMAFGAGAAAPLPTAEDYQLLALLNDLCDEVSRQNRLRSLRIITSEGVTLAAPDAPDMIGERTAFYEIDRAEIEEALATGGAVSLPFYWAEGNAHKRLYLPLYAESELGNIETGHDDLAATNTGLEADDEEIRLLIRLEAGAEFLEKLEQLRSIRRRVMLVMAGLVAALGVLFYVVLRRLQQSSENLARADRFRSLGRLAAGLAHELRNPLSIIRFNVEELEWQHRQAQEESAPENMKRAAAGLPEIEPEIALRDGLTVEVIEEVDRMNRLITNILSFSQEGDLNAHGTCDWRDIAERARRWVEKSAPPGWEIHASWEGAENREHPAPEELAINGDALLQILLNLCRNAVDALEGQEEPRPRIEITANYDGEKMIFAVADNGPGVPRKMRKRLFEPFNTSKEGGTGIGLAMSRRLAEAVGGALSYNFRENGGTEFCLRVPTNTTLENRWS